MSSFLGEGLPADSHKTMKINLLSKWAIHYRLDQPLVTKQYRKVEVMSQEVTVSFPFLLISFYQLFICSLVLLFLCQQKAVI